MWNWFCNFNIKRIIVLTYIPIKNTPHYRLKRFFIRCRSTGYVWLKKINILQFHKNMRLQMLQRPHWLWHTKLQSSAIHLQYWPSYWRLRQKQWRPRDFSQYTGNSGLWLPLQLVLSHSKWWPTSWKLKQQFEKRFSIFLNYKKRITISLLLHDRNHHNFFSW